MSGAYIPSGIEALPFPFRSPRGASKSFFINYGFLLVVGFLPAALCLRHSVHFLFISSLEQARLGFKQKMPRTSCRAAHRIPYDIKKSRRICIGFWVEDGIRTHDP